MRSIGISTRVFLAFTGVLIVFGGVLGYGVYRLHRVQRDARMIHHCYVPLSLTLSEAHTDLATYDAVLAERDKTALRRVVQAQKVLYPFAPRVAVRLDRARDFITTGFEYSDRASDIAFLERGRADIEMLRSRVDTFGKQSEAFRNAVLAGEWESAFAHQQRLRRTVDEMQTTLRDLIRATRAEVGSAIGRTDASEREALSGIIVMCVVASVVALLMMWLVHRTLRPIKLLTEAARTLGRGQYGRRVAVSRRDEVGELADEFNRMADKIEGREKTLRERGDELQAAYERVLELREQEERTKAELIKKERLAAIGRMTSQVTHELRNPLSSLGLNVELLQEELRALEIEADEEPMELIRAVFAEVDRLTEITEEYLAYARLPVARPRPTDVNDILEDLLGFMRKEMSVRAIDVDRSLDDAVPMAQADPNQLRRALLNLIRNAVEAMQGQGGALTVVTRRDSDTGDPVIEIGDSGPGIPEDDLEHIFDPFFSTKESGTGLGLPLTHQIIEEHGGRIFAASTVGKGTVFRIHLPSAASDRRDTTGEQTEGEAGVQAGDAESRNGDAGSRDADAGGRDGDGSAAPSDDEGGADTAAKDSPPTSVSSSHETAPGAR